MKTLLVSDLHLDDTAKNSYRWDIIGQIEDKIHDNNIDKLYILGDLTDKKNRHDAKFVHELIYQFNSLQIDMTFLAGNHDYIDQDYPFFAAFANNWIYGAYTGKKTENIKELWLPHVKNPDELYDNIDVSQYDICFTHLDVKGCILENGIKNIKGLPVSFFKNVLTFSGHIHNGQTLGKNKNFHYIASPYSIIYENENALHRGIILNYPDMTFKDTYFEFPRKIKKVIKNVKEIKEDDNNFYKYEIKIKETDISNYVEIERKIKNDKVLLKPIFEQVDIGKNVSIKKDWFNYFCKNKKIDKSLIDIGKNIIQGD